MSICLVKYDVIEKNQPFGNCKSFAVASLPVRSLKLRGPYKDPIPI